MDLTQLFNILDKVDSTNNYAMARIHDGLARHGMAWFTYNQTRGKGQRHKSWNSSVGENLILTIVLNPPSEISQNPFRLSAAISLVTARFLEEITYLKFSVKWPNDIYYGDRKAGGILIENVWNGNQWKWAVVGIGININQLEFPRHIPNPVSLYEITGEKYDVVALSRLLHQKILAETDGLALQNDIMKTYNEKLYGQNSQVLFSTPAEKFVAEVSGVNEEGKLLLKEYPGREFALGEIVWEIK